MSSAAPSPSTRIRRVTYFAGRVQGVGFRYTTQASAAGFEVTGFVRNLADGRVELVAEGLADELDRFLAAVEDAMRGNIIDRQSHDTPTSGEFTCFRIIS
jgi:acylphosphatase